MWVRQWNNELELTINPREDAIWYTVIIQISVKAWGGLFVVIRPIQWQRWVRILLSFMFSPPTTKLGSYTLTSPHTWSKTAWGTVTSDLKISLHTNIENEPFKSAHRCQILKQPLWKRKKIIITQVNLFTSVGDILLTKTSLKITYPKIKCLLLSNPIAHSHDSGLFWEIRLWTLVTLRPCDIALNVHWHTTKNRFSPFFFSSAFTLSCNKINNGCGRAIGTLKWFTQKEMRGFFALK